MKKQNKIFYWSPSLVSIATNDAVINSAYSLSRYNKSYDTYIINFFGEFERFRERINKKKIKTIDYYKKSLFNILPRHGKIKSRFSFIIIFLLSFYPLKNILKKETPDYLVIHLITSLPLILLVLFNFKTKFILRISGFPKLNFFRKFLWKMTLKKICFITCPTEATQKDMSNQKIVNENKIDVLFDPIISPKNIINNIKISKNNWKDRNYFLAIGRLTKQKNFIFLIDVFKKFNNNKNNKLIIVGEGEQKDKLLKFIQLNKLSDTVEIHNYTEEIFDYYKYARCFILSSLWEDPGFVLIEAAFCNLNIISSNCPNGPSELLNNGKDGFMYESDNKEDFLRKFNEYLSTNKKDLFDKRLRVKINSKNFTLFKHSENLKAIL